MHRLLSNNDCISGSKQVKLNIVLQVSRSEGVLSIACVYAHMRVYVCGGGAVSDRVCLFACMDMSVDVYGVFVSMHGYVYVNVCTYKCK